MKGISLLIVGGLLTIGGTIVGYFIKDFLDRKRLKEERKFLLQKEIYFNLQKKTEEIFEGLYILGNRAKEHQVIVKALIEGRLKEFIELSDEFKKERIRLPAILQLYFPSVDQTKYNRSVEIISKMARLNLKLYERKSLSGEEIKRFKELFREFKKNMFDLTEEISQELREEKRKVS